MSIERRERIARVLAAEIRQAEGPFTPTGRYHDSAYSPDSLREVGGDFAEAVILGELGRANVKEVARVLMVSDARTRALLEQVDGPRNLNFLSRSVVKVQMREIVRELADAGGRLVFVRTQPTSPTTGIRMSYGGRTAFGLSPDRKIGTFDTTYATYFSPFDGHEQSINLAGLVPALDKDREAYAAGVPMAHLSPRQFLSLTHPTAAMFRQAGAVELVVREELPPEVDARLYVFLQGRYEGYEESQYLSSPTHTVPIVNEPGYQKEAREALGDEVDIVVEAEGMAPFDSGLEVRHDYVASRGRVPNAEVRELVRRQLPFRFGSGLKAEHRDMVLTLLPGELRATLPDGTHEGGQALQVVSAGGAPRWFILLNKANGQRAWRGDDAELQTRLDELAEAFALLEGPDSTAGQARREHYLTLEQEFDVPMSHPSGRQNVWALAAIVRQGDLPDSPLGAPLV
jgi:hypothetical protein